MNRPEMVMFDFGHTLHYQHNEDWHKANDALYEYVINNPNGCTKEQFSDALDDAMRIADVQMKYGYEIEMQKLFRLAFGRLGVELSLDPLEVELLHWDVGTRGGDKMPGSEEMLDYLNGQGIRTAIITNNDLQVPTIKKRLDRLFPRNKFEFIISSCDYPVAKPDPRFFEIGLSIAGLSADKVWYCGDKISADILGSHSVGMFPVLYNYRMPGESDVPTPENDGRDLGFEYLHIHDWSEMTDVISSL